jgi:hypothetical protein
VEIRIGPEQTPVLISHLSGSGSKSREQKADPDSDPDPDPGGSLFNVGGSQSLNIPAGAIAEILI